MRANTAQKIDQIPLRSEQKPSTLLALVFSCVSAVVMKVPRPLGFCAQVSLDLLITNLASCFLHE